MPRPPPSIGKSSKLRRCNISKRWYGRLCFPSVAFSLLADARRDKDFVIIARTEALIAGWGQDEALNRAHHYEEAGADCIFIHSKSSTPDEIVEFARRWDGNAPLVIVPTSYPSLTE